MQKFSIFSFRTVTAGGRKEKRCVTLLSITLLIVNINSIMITIISTSRLVDASCSASVKASSTFVVDPRFALKATTALFSEH